MKVVRLANREDGDHPLNDAWQEGIDRKLIGVGGVYG